MNHPKTAPPDRPSARGLHVAVLPALTTALEKQGRESEFMALVRPAAEAATRSRVVNRWITAVEPEAARLATLQRAFSDSLAVMYLGFAEASGVGELKSGLASLGGRK